MAEICGNAIMGKSCGGVFLCPDGIEKGRKEEKQKAREGTKTDIDGEACKRTFKDEKYRVRVKLGSKLGSKHSD